MVEAAEANADEDAKRREQIETRNKADAMVHSIEKTLEELKDKVTADKRQPVENAVKNLREAVDKQDHDAIKKHMETVESTMRDLAAVAYSQADAGAPGGDAGGGKSDDDDVIDAEFEESN